MRAIGRCAVALEKATERCINVLLELIQTKVSYVVQEAIIVIKVGAEEGKGVKDRGNYGRWGRVIKERVGRCALW